MGFRIYRWVGSRAIWLKSIRPVEWGPPGQAMSFRHRAEAILASRLLPFKDQPALVVDGGSLPNPVPIASDRELRALFNTQSSGSQAADVLEIVRVLIGPQDSPRDMPIRDKIGLIPPRPASDYPRNLNWNATKGPPKPVAP